MRMLAEKCLTAAIVLLDWFGIDASEQRIVTCAAIGLMGIPAVTDYNSKRVRILGVLWIAAFCAVTE